MNKLILLIGTLLLPLGLSAAQVVNENVGHKWPDARYEVHGDGTVTDKQTGLMWMQCSLGQAYHNSNCSGSASTYAWQRALELARDNSFANHSDWRLPNVKELASLVALDRIAPSINSNIFPNTPHYSYWSASPYSSNSKYIWDVYFYYGDEGYGLRNYKSYVRLVRSSNSPNSDAGIISNARPEFSIDSTSIELAENSQGVVYDANATDANGDSIIYGIAGVDANAFVINLHSGELYFRSSPDYENTLDSDYDNTYELNLTASDGQHISTQELKIRVSNGNDNSPQFAMMATEISIEENYIAAADITASDIDGDILTYSISGDDADAFELLPTINANSNTLSFKQQPDYENPLDINHDNTYELTLTASDGDNQIAQDITVIVIDDNDNAPAASISVSPNPELTALTTATIVQLDASASSDLDEAELDYTWSQPHGQSIILSSNNAPSATFTATIDGTYTFTLTVSDGELESSAETTVTIYPTALPVNFTAIAGDTQVVLDWLVNANATVYNIYRSTDPNCDLDNYNTACFNTAGALFSNVVPGFVDTGLTNGTTYYYWLEASANGVTQRAAQPTSSTLPTGVLNDTGIDWSSDAASGSNSDCNPASTAQDCHHGRDQTHNDDSDGRAGFSFTKLDNYGNALDASATSWSCVLDNVTGLIWEVKTNDGSRRDAHKTYRWGGRTAMGEDSSNRSGDYYDDWHDLVNSANSETLCGSSAWRVPDVAELRSIVDYGRHSPSVDSNYFPNTAAGEYWSAAPAARHDPSAANLQQAWQINFQYGNGDLSARQDAKHLRLVRSR